MITRALLIAFALLFPTLLMAQDAAHTTSKMSKKDIKKYLKNYEEIPDTLFLGEYDPSIDGQYRVIAKAVPMPSFGSSPYELGIAPAQFSRVSEQVLLRQAYSGYPEPVYKSVELKVLVRDSYTEYYIVPAVYDTIIEKQMVQGTKMAWIKNKQFNSKPEFQCYNPSIKTGTCLWKLVTIPEQYNIIKLPIIKTPSMFQQQEKIIEAQYEVVVQELIDSAATAKNPLQDTLIKKTAEYKTIEKKVLLATC